eukprot:COSAG03_NODE_2159_length_3065_cov_5.757586_5_plen_53_part_00
MFIMAGWPRSRARVRQPPRGRKHGERAQKQADFACRSHTQSSEIGQVLRGWM